jgi:hypothetical protein
MGGVQVTGAGRWQVSGVETDDAFTVWPRRIADLEARESRWSVYLIRVQLDGSPPALKIGMVGSSTIGDRLRRHGTRFGPVELLDVWTVAHATAGIDDELSRWRLVEQYEARLQFAPEFVDPSARLRRLEPVRRLYSYEWFDDDPRVVDAVRGCAERPVTLPHGWALATGPDEHGPTR